MPSSSEDFGIYVHWPFCKAKCPYCDFIPIAPPRVDASHSQKHLPRTKMFSDITRDGSKSIFFGVAPSLMPPAALQKLDRSSSLARSDTVEITLEGTSHQCERKFPGLSHGGVNRARWGTGLMSGI